MDDLLDEMRRCESVPACICLAVTDAYGEDEQAVACLTCLETMFGRFQKVTVLGRDVALVGFGLCDRTAVAACRKDRNKAHVTLDLVEFPSLTTVEPRWHNAWKKFSNGATASPRYPRIEAVACFSDPARRSQRSDGPRSPPTSGTARNLELCTMAGQRRPPCRYGRSRADMQRSSEHKQPV